MNNKDRHVGQSKVVCILSKVQWTSKTQNYFANTEITAFCAERQVDLCLKKKQTYK